MSAELRSGGLVPPPTPPDAVGLEPSLASASIIDGQGVIVKQRLTADSLTPALDACKIIAVTIHD